MYSDLWSSLQCHRISAATQVLQAPLSSHPRGVFHALQIRSLLVNCNILVSTFCSKAQYTRTELDKICHGANIPHMPLSPYQKKRKELLKKKAASLYKQGFSMREVARTLGKSRQWVCDAVKDFGLSPVQDLTESDKGV